MKRSIVPFVTESYGTCHLHSSKLNAPFRVESKAAQHIRSPCELEWLKLFFSPYKALEKLGYHFSEATILYKCSLQ